MYCRYCGHQVDATSKFCNPCGRQLETIITAPTEPPASPQDGHLNAWVHWVQRYVNRKIIGAYLAWMLLHFCFWIIYWNDDQSKEYFWPFSTYAKVEDYDFSEFLFYTFVPLVLFIICILVRKEPHSKPKPPVAPRVARKDFPVQQPIRVNPYAHFFHRLVAAIIDTVTIQIFLLPVTIPLLSDENNHFTPLASFIGLLANWLYFVSQESGKRQATLGKQVMNINVTDLQGRRLTFAHATGRHFAKLLNAFTLLLGFLLPLFQSKRQALHDIIAATLVRRDESVPRQPL
jgi:uncharacterized RDD family membrane protein YckC